KFISSAERSHFPHKRARCGLREPVVCYRLHSRFRREKILLVFRQRVSELESNMFVKSKSYRVGDIIEPLLDEERSRHRSADQFPGLEEMLLSRPIQERQKVQGSAVEHSETLAPEAISSISSGLSIVGKVFGNGRLAIFVHLEGEVHASIVQIGDGAQVEG